MGHLFLGNYERAYEWAKKSLSIPNTQFWGNAALVASLAYLEKIDEANSARQLLLSRQPKFTLSMVINNGPITDPSYQNTLVKGLRKAGAPEE